MSCGYFECFILFIILQWTHCSLLSRFRYPNEYTAPPESILLPEDLPDDMYEGLIDERPDLKPILGPSRNTLLRRPKTSYTRKTATVPDNGPSVYHEFEFPYIANLKTEAGDEDEEESTMSEIVQYTNRPERLSKNTTDSSAGARSSRMLPFIMRNNNNQTDNDTRKWFDLPKWYNDFLEIPPWGTARLMATCYTCGQSSGIPLSPICHDLFDSQDWRARTMKRFFRSKCYYDYKWGYRGVTRKEPYWRGGYKYYNHRSLKTGSFGHYTSGCYKRFLDIGTVYTARGCRRSWPSYSGGLAATRFLRLEHLLRFEKDKCITSPHASLTPFSRSISLFARYHVCVCPGRYCNRATVSKPYNMFLLFLSLIFIALLI